MTDALTRHGGALDRMRAAFPAAPAPWIDLSTGINPWPYPVDGVPAETFAHLPTEAARMACHTAMADAFGAHAEALVVTPGTELVIRLLPQLLPRIGRIAVLAPGYGDHAAAWRAAGREVVETADPLNAATGCDAVMLSCPNNPDGRCFAAADLAACADDLARRGRMLIVDEAYADCAPGQSLAGLAGRDGLVVLRSFGKFYGLAGVRLGALLGPPDLVARCGDLFGCWPVSGPALWLGAKAYGDRRWAAATRTRLAEAAADLDRLLAAAGLAVAGGTSLFRHVMVADAGRCWRQLAGAGIYVRRFGWSDSHLRFGLPATAAARARLAEALLR